MQTIKSVNKDRVFFLDNLRYLMVLTVVIFHSAFSYSNYSCVWAVDDSNRLVFDYIIRIFDIFMMPMLFFIAGYFTIPSLRKANTFRFINAKIKRLGIPWLIGVVLFGPIKNFIYVHSRGNQSSDLWGCFIQNIKEALTFHTGYLISLTRFDHCHYWFVSLLLFFFIVVAIFYSMKKKLCKSIYASEVSIASTKNSILFVLFLLPILSTVITIFVFGIDPKAPSKESWIMVGNLIQFPYPKVILYVLCFSLGIYAFIKKWFADGNFPGHFILWIIVSIFLWYCRDMLFDYLVVNYSMGLASAWIYVRTSLFITIFLAFMSFSIKYFNNASKQNRLLAENSYNIYLLHLFFVYVLQLLLLDSFITSAYVKFGIVTTVSILLSYLTSQYLVRPFPRWFVVGIIVLFCISAEFIRA